MQFPVHTRQVLTASKPWGNLQVIGQEFIICWPPIVSQPGNCKRVSFNIHTNIYLKWTHAKRHISEHRDSHAYYVSSFNVLEQRFPTAGPRPGTGPWHQLHRAARDSPGICN